MIKGYLSYVHSKLDHDYCETYMLQSKTFHDLKPDDGANLFQLRSLNLVDFDHFTRPLQSCSIRSSPFQIMSNRVKAKLYIVNFSHLLILFSPFKFVVNNNIYPHHKLYHYHPCISSQLLLLTLAYFCRKRFPQPFDLPLDLTPNKLLHSAISQFAILLGLSSFWLGEIVVCLYLL